MCRGRPGVPSLPQVPSAPHALSKELVPQLGPVNIRISSAEEVQVKTGLQN